MAFRAREGLLGPQTGIVDCVEFPSGSEGFQVTSGVLELPVLWSVRRLPDVSEVSKGRHI